MKNNDYDDDKIEEEEEEEKEEEVMMASANKKKQQKQKKRRWDAVLVSIGMVIGFATIIMKITGYWPCHIISVMHITQISCDKSIQENVSSIVHWIQQQYYYHGGFLPHLLLQFLRST